MWSSCQVPVNRDLDSLNEKIKIPKGTKTLGSLKLDTKLQIPRYHTAVDNSPCQPGGYHSEVTEDDASAGLVYGPCRAYIWQWDNSDPTTTILEQVSFFALKNNHPTTLAPKKILDMGCSVGHSTVPYAQAFPDAEVHGIDVAAPMLRYAHARAEELGEKVHFSQQNAEQTNFKSGTFDLIVSHIPSA